jgi:hypothetical protein
MGLILIPSQGVVASSREIYETLEKTFIECFTDINNRAKKGNGSPQGIQLLALYATTDLLILERETVCVIE